MQSLQSPRLWNAAVHGLAAARNCSWQLLNDCACAWRAPLRRERRTTRERLGGADAGREQCTRYGTNADSEVDERGSGDDCKKLTSPLTAPSLLAQHLEACCCK